MPWPPLLPEETGFEQEGRQFRSASQPGGNKMPACFILQTNCSAGGIFHLIREGGVERFFKRVNLDSEMQTGDRSFDSNYYLITDDKDFTWQVMSDSRKRQAVEELFNLGFNVVTVDIDQDEAVIEPYDLQHALSEAISAITQLAANGRDGVAGPLPNGIGTGTEMPLSMSANPSCSYRQRRSGPKLSFGTNRLKR